MTEYERRVKKSKENQEKKKEEEEKKKQEEEARRYSNVSQDVQRRLKAREEATKPYTVQGTSRRNAYQNRTESLMNDVAAAEPATRRDIERYKAVEDSKYYANMNKRGTKNRDQSMVNRSVKGYEESYNRWKKVYDANKGTAATDPKTERQGQIKAQAQKIQRYTDTGTGGKDAREDDKRWAGVTDRLKHLGSMQRNVDTPGAKKNYSEEFHTDQVRKQYREAYEQAFPSGQTAKQTSVTDRYSAAEQKLRTAERDAYYWEQAAKDAAWFGDADRFTRSLPHIVESSRKVQGALTPYRQASDELAGAVREQDEKLKQGDLATWYARNLTDEQIRRRLEEEQKPISVTDKDRAENPGMYPDAAFRTMPQQSRFDPTMTAGGEAPGNRYYMTEQERQLTEQSDRELLQRKVDDREVQVTALQRALESHHVNDLEDRISWHAGRGELPEMARAGREAMARDASGEGAAGYAPTFEDLANGTVSAEAMAQGKASSALATVTRNLMKCTDQQKDYVYAMYAIDPQGAVTLSQKYYDDAMDEYYARFYRWASSDKGWPGGRRAAAAVLGVGAKLISGLDPFGDSGQDLSRTGEAFISGAAASASRNGLFGIEALGGDESPISSSIPYIGRGRAGEAYQLGTSVLESAGIAVPAMLIGRYDTAAAKVAGFLGTTLMGSSAAADDYRECINLGMSDSQAKWHATAAGIAEGAFEYWSLDKLIDPDNIRHGLLRMLTQGGIEASEEVCTTIANRISDTLIADFYGTQNAIEREALEYQLHGMSAEEAEQKARNQWLAGLMMDGLGGLFSGIIMGGGSDILQRGLSRVNSAMDTAAENYGSGSLLQLETAGYTNADTLDALTSYALANNIDVKALMDAQAKAAVSDQGAVVSVQETQGAETGNSQEAIGNSGRETTDRAEDGTPLIRQPEGLTPSPEGEGFDGGLETKDGGLGSARPTETKEGESAQTRSTENGEANENGEKPRLSKRDLRRAGKVRSQIVESLSSQFEGKTAAEQAAVYDSLVEQYGSGIEAVASEALYNTARRTMQSAENVPTLEQRHGQDAAAFQSETARNAVERAYRDAQTGIMRATGDTTESSVRSLRDASRRAGDGITLQAEVTGQDGGTRTVDVKGWTKDGTKVVLKDGTQVSVDSLQADENTKSFLQAMEKAKLGSYADEAFQTYLDSGARSLADGYSWIMGYRNAFGVGEVKGSVTTAVQQAARYGVDMETAAAAYYNGVMAVEAGNAQRAATVQRAIVKAGKAGVSGKAAVIDNSRINWDGLSREQKNQKKFLDKVAQAYGADVVWFDSSEGGKLGAMQGKYQDGKIWLDVNAGKNAVTDSAVAILGTMGHEMTHMMQDYSAELYQEYCDFALDAIRSVEGEAGLERMIRDRIDNRLRNIENGATDSSGKPLQEMSREEAIDEVVARFSEKIFSREESMQARLKDLQENHKDLWQKIKDFFKGWLDKVRQMLQQDTGITKKELQAWDKLSEEIQKQLAEKWGEGAADMARNLDLTEGVKLSEVRATENAATEGGTTQSEVSVNPQNSEGRLSERDTEYLELAKDPEKNREKLQEMVDEAAKEAGYKIKAYHAGAKNITAFQSGNSAGLIYFADTEKAAKQAARSSKQVYTVYLEADNPVNSKNTPVNWYDAEDSLKAAKWKREGYDAVYVKDEAGVSIAVFAPEQIKSADPVTYDDSGNVIPLSERFNTENEDIRYSEREADMPADVDLVMQMDEKDADTQEGKALIREAQAKQKQIETLREKLAEAKRQLSTTKRALNTKGIGNVAGNVIRDFGISDAGGKNIKQQATAILTEAYQKALDQIDSGAAAAEAWETVYNGAVEAANLLIDQGRYTENNNGRWTNVPYSKYIGEDRQTVIDQMVSEAAQDFVRNRYRAPVQETAADRLVARTEKRMQGKLDEARAKSAELKAANEKLEQDNAFLKDQAEDAQFVAGNLYDQVKDLRQELKDNRKLSAQERKAVQKKIEGLNKQIEAKKAEAAAWRDRANRNASLLKSALESKNRDIQAVKDESQRQIDRAAAEKEAAVRKLEAQIEREQRILAGKLKPPAMQKMLKEARETAAAEIMEKKNAQIERMREGRKAGALRSRIKNLHAEMQRTLLKPKEGHYVPQDLVRPVIDLLEMIDSNKLPQDIENLQKRIDAEKNPDKREALEERMITLKDRQEKASVKINAISAAYARMKGNENTGIYYDESVEAMLLKLGETVKGKTIYEMNSDELSDVFTVMKAMNTTIRNAVKADLVEKGRNIFEIGTSMIDELRNSKGAHRLQMLESWHKSQLSPLRAFKRFGGYMPNSTWLKMYDMLNNAQNQTMWLEMQGTRIFDDVLGTKADRKLAEKLSSTDEKDMVDVGLKDARGNSVKITRGMMLSLYMHMQNEDNMRHIMYGGISLPGMKQYYGKKSGDAWGSAKTRIPALGVRVSNLEQLLETLGEEGVNNAYKEQEQAVREMFDSVRQKIEKILTPYDRRWIAASKKFFDDFSRRELNKATMAMYGFNKASVDNYFPITSDPAFLKTDIDSIKRDASLENAGFMKARVKAGNPILLEDITKAVNRQITKVAQYAGMTQALKTFDNVYKVQQKGYADSVKEALRDKFEAPGQKYVENLLSDLVGGRSQESTLFDKIKGHYAQAVLSVNAPVTVKQAASFPTALPVVGWKALAKALAAGGKSHLPISRADRALIDTYTPLLWKRAQGAIDVELGDVAKGRDWTQKASWLMGWIQKTDLATVGRLWSAAEYYVRDNFKSLEKGTTEQIKKGESEYYRKVAEIFNRIVEETQPNYSVMQRPDILRNPNKLLRAVTMFSTQRLQNANILIDALGEYNAMRAWDKNVKTEESKAARKTARVNLVNAIASQAISTVVLNLMTFAGGALLHRMNPWRDDDDELTMEGIREEFLDGILSTFSGSFLWGSDAYDALHALLTDEKYYKGDVGGVSTMYDFIDSTVKSGKALIKLLKKDDKSWEDAKNLAHGQLYKTAEYLSQMAGVPLGNIKKILDGAYYHGVDILNKEFFSFEAGLKRANSTNARRFTKAWNAKDEAKMDKVLDEMFGNKVRTSDAAEGARDALSAAAKEAYQAGKMDMEEYVAFLKRPECFTDKGITSRITDRLKEDFIAGKRSAEETVELLLKYKDYKKNPEQSAWSAVKEWAAKAEFEKENGEDADDDDFSFSQYDELNDAVAADENVTAEIQELKAHGYTDKQINDALQDSIKKAFKDGTYTEEEAIDALVRYGATYSQNGKTVAFDKDKAWQTVREWAAKAGHEDEEGHLEEGYSYSLYDGLREAVTTGKGIEAAMKELTDHGVKASAVNDELNKTVLKLYTDGTITEKTAIGLLTKYHTVTKNKKTRLQTADEAWAALREASAKAAHTDEDGHLEDDYSYNKYEKIDAALDKNGDISKLVKELTDHGTQQKDITSHVKGYLIDRYVAGKTSESALKNQLSRYCGITKTDEVEKILKDAGCEKDCGYGFDELKNAYGRGDLSEANAKKMLRKYGGLTDSGAAHRIGYWDYCRKNPDTQIKAEAWDTYYEKQLPTVGGTLSSRGMKLSSFTEYREKRAQLEVTDLDGDGKKDEKAYVLNLINSMKLSTAEKDMLYYYNGYGARELWKTPWH